MRHWSINGRFLGQPVTGVQRYAREIVRELDRLLTAGHPFAGNLVLELLVPADATPPTDLQSITVRVVPGIGGQIWEQTRLSAACRGGLLSLCNVGPVAKRRHIVCVHDLNTRLVPESYTFPFRALYRALLPALGRSAALVTTVSQFSAAQLTRFRICDQDKIRVIPNGHEHVFRFHPQHNAATRDAAGPRTIVLLGSLAPHKNIDLILSLAQELEAIGLRIAIVGSVNARSFRGRYGPPARDVRNVAWIGPVDGSALAALLQDSLCLAFPSLTEGFGLPPVEAMALGCPVIASDQGSIPEICGSASLYAGPADRDAWLRHFRTLACDERMRADLIAKGKHQAARFRWSDSASAYLEAMARIDGVALPHERA